MIFVRPEPVEPLDQGDIIDGCPIVSMLDFNPSNSHGGDVERSSSRVYVLTQT